MPTLGAALDFAKYEGRQLRAHQLGAAPSSPVTGQLYYNTGDNTLWWYDGTTWQSAKGGAASTPPATTIALGTIQLAGDLAGTATSPQIAAGVITDVEVAAANKDGVVALASMRTLGAGAQQAMPGNRTLDAVTAPAADVNLNSKRIISLLDPTAAQDAATKAYVDSVAQGLDAMQSVRAATTANITLSGTQTVDGVALIANDRCLVKNQTTPAQNGVYTVAAGAWTRALDQDVAAEFPSAYTFVEEGTTQADTGWVCTVNAPVTVGTTGITWAQFTSAASYIAGGGLTLTGSTFDVGAGAGITVNADTIQVANNGITNAMIADGAIALGTADVTGTLGITNGGTGQTSAKTAREAGIAAAGYYTNNATHGAGTTIVITQATHLLRASRALHVQVQDNATGNVEIPDISVAANGDVTVTYGASVSANTKLVSIVG